MWLYEVWYFLSIYFWYIFISNSGLPSSESNEKNAVPYKEPPQQEYQQSSSVSNSNSNNNSNSNSNTHIDTCGESWQVPNSYNNDIDGLIDEINGNYGENQKHFQILEYQVNNEPSAMFFQAGIAFTRSWIRENDVAHKLVKIKWL